MAGLALGLYALDMAGAALRLYAFGMAGVALRLYAFDWHLRFQAFSGCAKYQTKQRDFVWYFKQFLTIIFSTVIRQHRLKISMSNVSEDQE
jgi:hypothetical protein